MRSAVHISTLYLHDTSIPAINGELVSGLLCTVNYVSNELGSLLHLLPPHILDHSSVTGLQCFPPEGVPHPGLYSACCLPASSIAPLRSAKSQNTSSSSGTLSFFSRAMPLSCTSCEAAVGVVWRGSDGRGSCPYRAHPVQRIRVWDD